MKNLKKGFTLIELLVVISIIGILASLTLVSYTGAQKQTRDTQRRSDLNQIRNSLENYAGSNNGLYPDALDSVAGLCAELVPSFMTICPDDPSADQDYGFYSSATGDEFVIYGILETGGYWEVCSTGGSGKVENQPSDSTCDLT